MMGCVTVTSRTLPFWWRHIEAPGYGDGGQRGRTHQLLSRMVTPQRSWAGWMWVGMSVSFLPPSVNICVWVCVCLGRKGTSWKNFETRVDMCRPLAKHDLARNLREHSEAWLPEFESQLHLLKPGWTFSEFLPLSLPPSLIYKMRM